jgi:hypothetical protein
MEFLKDIAKGVVLVVGVVGGLFVIGLFGTVPFHNSANAFVISMGSDGLDRGKREVVLWYDDELCEGKP